MKRERFSLKNLLNEKSQEIEQTDLTKAAEPNFRIELLSVHHLEPSEDNFYSVADVDDLKDSIELLGIQQNLTVRPIIGTGNYKVIAGHRRRLASLRLVEEGKQQFELVPCRVETNLDEIKEKIMLIYTNSTTRQLTDWEKVAQLSQLKELFREYKKTHELPGRIRELLAEALNVSPSQVGRIESIKDNLMPELKEELKHNNIGFSAAAELSRLSVDDQRAIYEQHKKTGTTGLKEVRVQKEKAVAAKPEPVNPTIQALVWLKAVLDKEIDRFNTTKSRFHEAIADEYCRILSKKIIEVEKELFKLQGKDLFGQGGAADGG